MSSHSFKHQLEAACQSGDLELTHRLHSAWLNKQHPDPTTGLIQIKGWHLAASQAVQHNHPACLAYLFRHGYRVDEWNNLAILASHTASTSGDTRCLQVLLDHGWDINSPEPHNEPPVLRAGNIDSVRWLLDHGADPLKRSRRIIGSGTTPIDTAIYMGHDKIAALLIDATGDPRQSTTLQRPLDIDQVAPGNGISAGRGNRAIQDYSMHLMLVESEREKKRRAAREKQEQLSHNDLDTSPTQKGDEELQKLMQQAHNKKRALMNHPSLHDPPTEIA
ncbi:MAG: hypothetical protein Q9176_004952 [Flavoplaca citrina]